VRKLRGTCIEHASQGAAVFLLASLFLVGCGDQEPTASTQEPRDSQTKQSEEANPPPTYKIGRYEFSNEPQDGQLPVTTDDFGRDWPLTVAEGTLVCEDDAVYFDSDGVRYGINGWADGAEIQLIWRDARFGLKKNIGPLIDVGLKLC
jgi:hypothetical protein